MIPSSSRPTSALGFAFSRSTSRPTSRPSVCCRSPSSAAVPPTCCWFCPEGYPNAGGAIPFADERALLEGFVRRVRELDPDVVTGWNVVDFDLVVLKRIADRLGVALDLGRPGDRMRIRPSRSPWSGQEAILTGRVVLDGIHLLRGAFVRMPSYGLDAVAREVLGTGKTLTGSDRGQDIMRAFKEDREQFVTYNRTDAQLVLDILDQLHLVDLAVERSKLTGLPMDRVSGAIAAFDFLYLEALHRRRRVAPSVRDVPQADRHDERRAQPRRPRLRAATGPLRACPGLRLQEPLSERDPHLPRRPLGLSRRPRCRGRAGSRWPHRGAQRRPLRPSAGHSDRHARRPLSAARSGPRPGTTRSPARRSRF